MTKIKPHTWAEGEIVHGAKSDFLILENIRIRSKNSVGSKKGYIYRCLKCNYIGERLEYKFEHLECPVCSGHKVKWNINSVAAMHPESIFWFKNIEEAYLYSPGSHIKTDFICPKCDSELKQKQIKNVINYGLYCPYCSDGISIGERILRSFLSLQQIEFEAQKAFDWSDGRIYDFYIPKLNCIIETHGEQHYETGSSFESVSGVGYFEEHENDTYKEAIALENGIENYIVVDCMKSNFDYIKNSILTNEKIEQIFGTATINWRECEILSAHSMVHKCAELWNQNYSISEIIQEIQYGYSSINNWLNQAQKIGLCSSYSSKEANRRKGTKCINVETQECFWSMADCARHYNERYETIVSKCDKKGSKIKLFSNYITENNLINNFSEFFTKHLVTI